MPEETAQAGGGMSAEKIQHGTALFLRTNLALFCAGFDASKGQYTPAIWAAVSGVDPAEPWVSTVIVCPAALAARSRASAAM